MSRPTLVAPAPAQSEYVNMLFAKSLPCDPAKRSTYSGFYSEPGQDDAFDAACTAAVVTRGNIYHVRTGTDEPPVIKNHWLFPTIEGFVIAAQIQSVMQLVRTKEAQRLETGEPLERHGIALGWGTKQGKPNSFMRIPFLLRAPIHCSTYEQPVILSFNGTVTDAVYAALVTHDEKVIGVTYEAAEAKAKERGKVSTYQWRMYSSAMIWMAAADTMTAGTTTQQQIVYPMVVVKDDGVWLNDRIARGAEFKMADDWLDVMVPWSVDLSAAVMTAGQRTQG
jgi:hypothetical protein